MKHSFHKNITHDILDISLFDFLYAVYELGIEFSLRHPKADDRLQYPSRYREDVKEVNDLQNKALE